MKTEMKHLQQGRLAMTFSLRQALELLQMPQAELSSWLEEEIEKNPLLEPDRMPSPLPSQDLSLVEALPSLQDHLMSQIRERFPDRQARAEAVELLKFLDERGFVPEAPHSQILPILQSFDPPGIFARDLKECLLLQLRPASPAYLVVSACFKDLLHGRFETIKEKTGLIDLAPAIQALSRLNLRPGDLFKQEIVPLAIADLAISKLGKTWIVEAREEYLPQFHLRTDYAALCPDSREEQQSLRTWLASGKWLLRSLKRRKLVLLEIGAFLVRKQAAYLDRQGSLQPLSLQEIAQHLGLHESTISRAFAGKYAHTPRGLLPLRSLVSASPETEAAKIALQQLIAHEDKRNPMSDEAIVAHLRQTGIKLARRTIAKYRRALKIGRAALRKHASPKAQ